MGLDHVKNNRGFTVVELVVSFTITLVVILLLFQIVISLKDLYVKDGIRTELLIKQSLMGQKITTDLNDHKIVVASKCTSEANCLSFTFDDGSVKTLSYNKSTNMFHYGDYTTKLVAGSKFGNIEIMNETFLNIPADRNDSLIKIKIPITHNLAKGDYGISLDYLYDSRKVAIGDLNISGATTTEQIFLKGNSNLVLQDTAYTEPGYYVRKTNGTIVDNDSRVTQSGTVGTAPGIYKITYNLTVNGTVVSSKQRTVSVIKTVTNFDYTNSAQTYSVPIKGNYKIELWGAQGGSGTGTGGKGAYTSGTLVLNAGENLYVYVGNQPTYSTGSCVSSNANNSFNGSLIGSCTGGGGATDIRLSSGAWNDTTGLRSRIMVAAGGGGAYYAGEGGYGGALTGGAGIGLASNGTVGVGATQTTAGNGSFGISGHSTTIGGGGYYGGSGGYAANAGGGSSFISGYNGCNAVTSAGTHTGAPNHYSNKIFDSAVMTAGNGSMPNPRGSGNIIGNTGNGFARITLISIVS